MSNETNPTTTTEETTVTIAEETNLFQTMNLSAELIHAIEDMNYTQMTEIQNGTIPLIMEKKDVIGRSSTGTGKTAAFGIPAVEMIEESDAKCRPQVLVLSPTRELAMQIAVEMTKYAKYKRSVRIAVVCGGQPMEPQIKQLKTANIVIGTPGRIMDHMRRRTLRLEELKLVILDEADEMLNMGFHEDIQTILSESPEERQTVLFSATMPPAILKITTEFQKSPKMVAVDQGQKTLDTIDQSYYYVPLSGKKDALNLILRMYEPKRSIIFCNTKKMVDELVKYLDDYGYKSVGLHGDMRQMVRTQVMQNFRTGKLNILVATDVAARGIDVDDIEAVFNFDIPQEFEYYIHRIGRTGRAGKSGAAYTLVCGAQQLRSMRELMRFMKADIVERPLPSHEDILKKKQDKFAAKVRVQLERLEKEPVSKQDAELVALLESEGYTAQQIAAALLTMLGSKAKQLIPTVKSVPSAPMGGASAGFSPAGRSSDRRSQDNGSSVIELDVGRNQKMAPNFIVGAIVEGTGLPAATIGKIEIFADRTTVKMSAEHAKQVVAQMEGVKIKGLSVKFTLSSKPSTRGGDSRRYGNKDEGGYNRRKKISSGFSKKFN